MALNVMHPKAKLVYKVKAFLSNKVSQNKKGKKIITLYK